MQARSRSVGMHARPSRPIPCSWAAVHHVAHRHAERFARAREALQGAYAIGDRAPEGCPPHPRSHRLNNELVALSAGHSQLNG